MAEKVVALALALSFAGLLAVVPSAQGRGKDDVPPAPEC